MGSAAADDLIVPKSPLAGGKVIGGADPAESSTMAVDARSVRPHLSSPGITLPNDLIVEEILMRLPAKAVFRCRAVCHTWRTDTSTEEFVSAFGKKPALPLVALDENSLQSLDVLAAAAAAEHQRPVLALNCFRDFLCASCDGLLLVTFGNGRHNICNPATRQSLPLPHLTHGVFAGLYPSPTTKGEYRVLLSKGGRRRVYYVFTVGSPAEPRRIQLPQAPDDLKKALLVDDINAPNPRGPCYPPTVLLNGSLHWVPECCQHHRLVVFHTVAESFGSMPSPTAATHKNTSLFVMDGQLGMSLFDDISKTMSIWLLQDYQNELWALKHTINLSMVVVGYMESYMVLPMGDVLLSCRGSRQIIHSDSEGNILNEFSYEPRNPTITGHSFNESIVRHTFFQRKKGQRSRRQPPFLKDL